MPPPRVNPATPVVEMKPEGTAMPKGVGGVVDVTPDAPRPDAGRPRRRIHAHALHAREVNHQATVTGPQASPVVAATANRRQQVVFASKLHCGHNVGNVHATRDQLGTLVDHAVIDPWRADS